MSERASLGDASKIVTGYVDGDGGYLCAKIYLLLNVLPSLLRYTLLVP